MARIRVLSPIGAVTASGLTVPSLPPDLAGRSVGFIDNNKSNFGQLVTDIAELLIDREKVRRVVHRKKANASTPAPPEILAELAKECDVVFAGSAD
jgi:hypothetical protein